MSGTKRLQGKVAVVTGGNSGIGLATAKRLQEEGARVVISGRNQKTLNEAVKEIGNGIVAVKSDVSVAADLDKLYATVSQKLGKIDVLFANAGIYKFAPFQATSETLYDELFDINTRGVYFTIQKALPFLNDGASVIINTSVADEVGLVNGSAYAATKAALRSFTRSLAAELTSSFAALRVKHLLRRFNRPRYVHRSALIPSMVSVSSLFTLSTCVPSAGHATTG